MFLYAYRTHEPLLDNKLNHQQCDRKINTQHQGQVEDQLHHTASWK